MIANCHETRPLDHTRYTRQGPRLSRVRQPLKKKKKTHSAEPQFASMNIYNAKFVINVE